MKLLNTGTLDNAIPGLDWLSGHGISQLVRAA